MSKLDELIRELCPDGVEYKKLGEIATVLRGASPRPIKKYITNDSDGVNWIKIGDVPVGSKYITQSEEKITKEGAEKSRYVQKGDFILSNSMSFGRPYILAIDGCIHDGWLSISNFKDVFLSDYLYYLLSSSAIQQEMKKRASFGGAVQNLNADIVKALVLPVPPIEVQSEIVRMLDSYTESVVELQRQLTAELTARKTQYSYYRDKLLTFDVRAQKKKIGELTRVFSAARVHKNEWTTEGVPFYRSSDVISKFNGVENSRGKAYISFDLYKKLSEKSGKIMKDDILITGGGSIGIPYIVPTNDPIYVKDADLLCIQKSDKFNSRFLYHYFLSTVIVLFDTVAEHKSDAIAVHKLLQDVMAFAGLCVILQTVRVGILEYRELNVINTLVSFFIPIVYLLLVTPLEYAFELYSKYEMLFIQMHFKEPSDKMVRRKRHLKVIKVCGLSVKRIMLFQKQCIPRMYISMPDVEFDLLISHLEDRS